MGPLRCAPAAGLGTGGEADRSATQAVRALGTWRLIMSPLRWFCRWEILLRTRRRLPRVASASNRTVRARRKRPEPAAPDSPRQFRKSECRWSGAVVVYAASAVLASKSVATDARPCTPYSHGHRRPRIEGRHRAQRPSRRRKNGSTSPPVDHRWSSGRNESRPFSSSRSRWLRSSLCSSARLLL